jgi:hypothetical protein
MRWSSDGTLRFAATIWLVISAAHASADQPAWLDVTYPVPDERVTELIPLLEVRGRAVSGPLTPYDLVVAIDLSASALLPTGHDIDGDGIVGTLRPHRLRRTSSRRQHRSWTTDPGDTIARAEIQATRRLLRQIDERWTRVGVVTFTGSPRTRASLGHPERALLALDRLKVTHDPSGTNLASCIRLGLYVLRESPADRERILVILSDGYPTRPYPEHNARMAALSAAKRAAKKGVRIYTFAIGEAALERPDVLREVARLTHGRFFEVADPGEIVKHLPSLDVALLEGVSLTNRTTGALGRAVRVFSDGSFDGYLQLQPGQNDVTIEARAPDGSQLRIERTVHYSTPERTTVGDLKRAAELSKALRARTAETELAARAHRELPLRRSLQIELDRSVPGPVSAK